MKRNIIISFVLVCILIGAFYYCSQFAFTGVFEKKYTREELVKNFIRNEKEFSELVIYFNAIIPKNKEQTVSFGLSKADKVNLSIYPIVINPTNKILGGDNLEVGSRKLDSALMELGWTNEIVKSLRDKLSRTNCDWIATTEKSDNFVQIYPNQNGWGSYSYSVYDRPIVDSLIAVYGKPINNYGFGSRVILNYSSAL